MRLRAIVGAVLLLVFLNGCGRPGLGGSSITFDTVYPAPNQSDVTVRYSLPGPPKGKVYVLWILNPFEGKIANAGTLTAGRDRTAHATVDFTALGAVVSIESGADPSTIGADRVLSVGQVAPQTPTPSVIDLTPTPIATPSGSSTPVTRTSG